MKVKICGITNLDDYREAVRLGADWVGFVFCPRSPRFVRWQKVMAMIRQVLDRHHRRVGIFVNESVETVREVYHEARLDIVQLQGTEGPDYVRRLGLPCWKVIQAGDRDSMADLDQYHCDTIVMDTDATFDLGLLRDAAGAGKRIIVNGDISQENVEKVFQANFPVEGLNLSSSIEERPGRKNPIRMRDFFHTFNRLKEAVA